MLYAIAKTEGEIKNILNPRLSNSVVCILFMRQASLFPPRHKTVHGGEIQGKRKTLRPLSRRRPIHFVLKARRQDIYRQHREEIRKELLRLSVKFQLRVYDLAVNHDHLHFIARIPGRQAYTAFIRSFSGILARRVDKSLWRFLPFSRVLSWGKDYKQCKEYLKKNREEAAGVRAYTPRRSWYKRQTSPA